MLGRSRVSLPVLQTMIVEVEAVLNNRPLIYTSSDVDDPQPLTPAHLLNGRMITRLPHECQADDLNDPDYVDFTSFVILAFLGAALFFYGLAVLV